MAIKINWQDLQKRFINWQEILRVYKNWGQIRPDTVPPWPDYLYFSPATAEGSTITLNREGTSSATFETSYDKQTWSSYTVWTAITVNQWQKLYWRRSNDSSMSESSSKYHIFIHSSVNEHLGCFHVFSSVQSLSRVRLFATPWTAASQASLSITNSQNLPKTHVHWVSDAIQ